MKKFDKPTKEEQDKCFRLRCQSKTGVRLHSDDMFFIELMYIQYPEWYESTDKDVFNATKPFGGVQ